MLHNLGSISSRYRWQENRQCAIPPDKLSYKHTDKVLIQKITGESYSLTVTEKIL